MAFLLQDVTRRLKTPPHTITRLSELEGSGFQLLLLMMFILHVLTINEASNLHIFNTINGFSTSIPAWLQASVTNMGDGVTLGAMVLCYLVFRPKLTGRVVVAALLSLIVVPLLKQYFDAPRPAVILDYLNVIGKVRHEHSFPSGHAATSFLLAGIIFLSTSKSWVKCSAVIVATVVASSRIMVGAHWPEDVVMGAFVGLLCAYGAVKMMPLIAMSDPIRIKLYLVLFTVIVLSEFKNGDNYPEYWQVQAVRWVFILLSGLLIVRFWMRNKPKANSLKSSSENLAS
ncbi:phosphatase PAP2 family protein [Shewanella sp. VB17]|uniref:phosphatase PAP2 family protein n=1 Tax=Shewanella sp. VB17 TaxID=2739432 RepID=UPI001566AD71|nr:phosphatase PAP2 family protein [Shewanella sp. VB17]NRD71981.1 phosphatase PAP2 family protein [Shewanella sp. VB17]